MNSRAKRLVLRFLHCVVRLALVVFLLQGALVCLTGVEVPFRVIIRSVLCLAVAAL
ncbi:hypothetical protein SAMN05192561_1136 [Halopenitus malekzadehii]|uniref:Uncharacterized protein n=1 Tax=Halopenitus malekzadehii TaxID=1267564 RepID=A0A1H6JQI2_9EURY|nr:hypothetical protein SAMN05192561_1136 [Halopenitus malekzadehii]